MAYLSNPVYCGVGAVDKAEASALMRNANFADTFSEAYEALSKMSAGERQQVLRRVKNVLDKMSYTDMEDHIDTALQAAKVLDPRRAPGLGQVSALSSAAQIAGIIASLTTTAIGVTNFIQSRKTAKDQKSAFEAQQALVKQQMQAQIDAEKQQQQAATTKARVDALASQGLTMDAQGNIVKKSSTGTVAAIIAAGAGAFFLAK